MKVGIIEAGEPPRALVPNFGTYAAMTRRLLGDTHDYETYRAFDGRIPKGGECSAFVITGSACSAYDNLPWIGELERFLRSARHRAKLVGICFGHQIMAQAFGGTVQKAKQGWGLGLQRYAIRNRAAWMDGVNAIYATASHQDQIVAAPPDSCVIAASDFVPCAILSYRGHPAISMQFHPEFDPAFAQALFADRRAPDLTQDDISRAISSMTGANDNARIGRWINGFLAD